MMLFERPSSSGWVILEIRDYEIYSPQSNLLTDAVTTALSYAQSFLRPFELRKYPFWTTWLADTHSTWPMIYNSGIAERTTNNPAIPYRPRSTLSP
ncbi:hypothetical protein T265_10077 [Opisthorchis viverrini]|uniref:Uncharacterized protein n=1 Tax=Opisthorchis viverrini TaxID=6198 RepID=A0A074Z3M2_OPIVI|nr:hypothetical protein T265_10077 [Opisthorchis viverrini]KER21633.1 hypothetical protein T265_10077 [Opisthorchis viverrini]